jgi:hypothetical protein
MRGTCHGTGVEHWNWVRSSWDEDADLAVDHQLFDEVAHALASILHEPSLDADGGFLPAGSRFVLGMGRPIARLSRRVGAGFHGTFRTAWWTASVIVIPTE